MGDALQSPGFFRPPYRFWSRAENATCAGRSDVVRMVYGLPDATVMQERGLEPDEVVAQAQTAVLRDAFGNCQSSASGLPKPIVGLDL